jgi:hypothetical protein
MQVAVESEAPIADVTLGLSWDLRGVTLECHASAVPYQQEKAWAPATLSKTREEDVVEAFAWISVSPKPPLLSS